MQGRILMEGVSHFKRVTSDAISHPLSAHRTPCPPLVRNIHQALTTLGWRKIGMPSKAAAPTDVPINNSLFRFSDGNERRRIKSKNFWTGNIESACHERTWESNSFNEMSIPIENWNAPPPFHPPWAHIIYNLLYTSMFCIYWKGISFLQYCTTTTDRVEF